MLSSCPMNGSHKIEITNLQSECAVNSGLLEKVLDFAIKEAGAKGGLSLAIVDSEEITELNRRFLGREEPTDVLSFPMLDDNLDLFGEVVVCADVAAQEAAKREISFDSELALYAVHGFLHLVGFDDQTPAQRARMRKREREILEHFGLSVS